ncbi:MAG: hypothetical protein NC489_45895, partial [Ruminococcus flavefaciens]|nr:hypothetical protein [Ruminococcus flavefaciens]
MGKEVQPVSVWSFEWKKVLYYQKAGVIIFAYLLGIFIHVAVTDTPVSYEMDKNRKSYEYYLGQVSGAVDGKTRSFFEEQSNVFSKAESEIQTIYRKYSNGEFPEDEYRRKLSELEELMEKKQGFTVLFDQYSHARENTKNRYLLNTNAWDALLSNDTLNIPLVLVVMLVALLVFGVEYSSEMDILLRMSKKGEREAAG